MDLNGYFLGSGPGTSFLSREVLALACNASCSAYKSTDPFVVNGSQDRSTVVIAFSGCQDPGIFQTNTKFGECKPSTSNNDFCRSLKDASNEAALVHEGVLKLFSHIWNNSIELQNEVEAARSQGKTIVFTGHSLGGGIAALATMRVLEESHSVFCVTFGFPLIGDENLARAIRRERWANRFCHVVLRRDIFARALVAPWRTISEPLKDLMAYWRNEMTVGYFDSTDTPMREAPPSNPQIGKFVATVLKHASALVNYSTATRMAPASSLINSLRPIVKLSPYRPFGYYVFCSESGAVWVENYEAVLPMLYYTLQSSSDAYGGVDSEACISDHVGYGAIFPKVIQNLVKLEGLENLALSNARSPSQETAIAIQMEALGLGILNVQARLALRTAGETVKQLFINSKTQESELRKVERAMAELEGYREKCLKRGVGYYDSFKLQKNESDFKANLCRLVLAGFWDKIVDMVEKHELPDDFPCREHWIKAGTAFRLLVEPLDIANYYRLDKDEDSGHYLSKGRPRRYRILEKWLEGKKQGTTTRTEARSLTQNSCFWGYLEEVSRSISRYSNMNEKPAEVKLISEEFQKRVKLMVDSHDLSAEVFLPESSFIKWWQTQLTPQERSSSPLFHFMEGGVKQYCGTAFNFLQ
eukprot:Gb_07500 [translate_table: standard]